MTDFNVSYVFQALDSFSPTSRKISASILKIDKDIRRLDKNLKKFNLLVKKDLFATAKAFNSVSTSMRSTVAASGDLTRASSNVDRYTAAMHRTKSSVDATNRSMLEQQAILSKSFGMGGMRGMGVGVPYQNVQAYTRSMISPMLMPAAQGGMPYRSGVPYQNIPTYRGPMPSPLLMPAMLGGAIGVGAAGVPKIPPVAPVAPAPARVGAVGAGMGAGALASRAASFVPFAGPMLGYMVTASTIRQGSQFEKSLANMSAITGVTGSDLKQLGEEGKQLAFKYATQPQEVVAAQKRILSAMDQVMKNPKLLRPVTDAALLLMRASGGELQTEQAAMALTRSLNAFQDSPLLSAQYADILAASAKWGAAELPSVANTMGRGAWGFDLAGWNFFDLAVATQGVAKKFQDEMAGTGLAMIGQRISLRSGLSTEKLGMIGTIKVLKKVYDLQETSELRSKFLMEMAGLHHGKMLMELMSNIEFMEELNVKMKERGVALEQAEINMDTYDAKVELLGTVIKTKQIEIFDQSSGALTSFVTDLTTKIETSDTRGLGNILAIGATTAQGTMNILGGALDLGLFLPEVVGASVAKVESYFSGDQSWSEMPDITEGITTPLDLIDSIYAFTQSLILSEEPSQSNITITLVDPTSQIESVNIDQDDKGPPIGVALEGGL